MTGSKTSPPEGVFVENKYTLWYHHLVQKAISENRKRERPRQYDRHHIVPTSLGGADTKANTVLLTPREHYVCHLLLLRMTTGRDRSKMVYAFFRFSPKNRGVTSSKSYQRFLSSLTASSHGTANAFYGRRHTDQTKALIREHHGMRGRSCYDVWVDKYGKEEANRRREVMLAKRSDAISGERNPMHGRPRTAKQRAEHSVRMSGSGHPRFGKKLAWISRSGETKLVEAVEASTYLKAGWVSGRKG